MPESREALIKQRREAERIRLAASKDWRSGNQNSTVAAVYRAAERRIERIDRRLRRLDLNERDRE